jgi:protein involved in polysaccharide export with SLBB domain
VFITSGAPAQAAPELNAPAKSPLEDHCERVKMNMKSPIFAALVLSASLGMTASAQVKSVAAANKQPGSEPTTSQPPANASRVRVVAPNPKPATTSRNDSTTATLQARTKPDFNNHSEARVRPASATASLARSENLAPKNAPVASKTGHASLKPAGFTNTTTAPNNSVTTSTSPVATVSSQIYRVGVRDVLDIQLSDNPSRNSTLFTVLADGTIEYPLAGNPIVVDGLTASEVAALLRRRIKIFDNPSVVVSVRDYASHTVTISGFVIAPGTKTLRREAVPLYTLLAESLALPEAARATITRQGRAPIVVDLKDANLSATLVVPGDAIKVSGVPSGPTEFFFVGGEINSPGQKPYHAGLTLTQAILASGGTTASAGSKIRVSRQGADGRLSTEEYNLRKIQAGKIPDPVLQKGDRIEVTNSN